MVEVIGTAEFEAWFLGLSDPDGKAVARAVDRLQEAGLTLGYPYSSAIKGSKYPLRELRIQSGGRPLRVFYVFDPERQAVLLIGGDKTGDARFYKVYVPKAESIWEQFLEDRARLRKEGST